MNRKEVIRKLADHFSTAALKTAVQSLTPTPTTDEGQALLDAALQLTNDADDTWFTALAVICVHDSKLAARLLQTATQIDGNYTISGVAQNACIKQIVAGAGLTHKYAGQLMSGIVKHPKTKGEVIAELFTHFSFDYLRYAVDKLNARSPKDEGIDILYAACKLDPPVDPLQTWFTALAALSVHNPKLAEAVLESATLASGHPVMNMNKAELIDAIASGSKLTKADAG